MSKLIRKIKNFETKKWEVKMNHKNLRVWQESFSLCKNIFDISNNNKFNKYLQLKIQLQKTSLSIVSNIAEGCARKSNIECLNFLNYSLGSVAELETQLLLAYELYLLNDKQTLKDLKFIKILLIGLISHIKKTVNK